jgi:hypothetical protein
LPAAKDAKWRCSTAWVFDHCRPSPKAGLRPGRVPEQHAINSSVWIIEDTSQCKDKPKTDSRTAPQALGLRPFEDG